MMIWEMQTMIMKDLIQLTIWDISYNGDNNDESYYGTPPPAVAHMLVQGPIVQSMEQIVQDLIMNG